MIQTMAPRGASTQPDDEVDSGHDDRVVTGRRGGGILRWLMHFGEMVVAMMVGMCVGVWIFTTVVGVSYKQYSRSDPTAALLVMALSMAIPMVAWMLFRRHTWRNSMEMGAAMLLPTVPFLACIWAHVVDKAPNGPYMMVSTVAMIALMLYRWDVYSTHHQAKPVPAISLGDDGQEDRVAQLVDRPG